MKVLLTGASGFLGKNFLEYAPKDIEILGVYNDSKDIKRFVREKKLSNVQLHKCDFLNKEELKNLFKKIGKKIDYCIYLAGNVNIPFSMSKPAEDLKRNVTAMINFLQSVEKISRFVYMSSTAVYDGNIGRVTVGTKLNPKVPYCISKLAAEQYVRFFASKGKIDSYVIIRFGGAYGRYSKDKFVNKTVREICVLNKRIIDVYGDGTNVIDVMYVKDAIKALLECLISTKRNITCNLVQGGMTVTEIINSIAKICNRKVDIKYAEKRNDQKYIKFTVYNDFNDIFNFKPDYSFDEGVKELSSLMKNEG